MSIDRFDKAPGDVLDYDFDFTRWLASGDRIASASASIAGGSTAVDTTSFSDQVVRVWVSGGSIGDSSTLTVIVSTAEGRTKTVTARIRVKEAS